MRIMHIVETLHRGGLERVVTDLALTQSRQMHDVAVICILDGGLLIDELIKCNIFVSVIKKKNVGTLNTIKSLRTIIDNWKPDVVHTHNPIPNYITFFATLGKRGLKIINTRHGMGVYWKSRKGKLLYLLSQLNTKYVVSVCDTANKEFIWSNQVIVSKSVTVKNGIDPLKFAKKNNESKYLICQELGIPVGSKIIGTVGRINFVKNQEILIRALDKLRFKFENINLIIVGDGELIKHLKEVVKCLSMDKHIHFFGDRDDVHLILQGLDCFVLPSLTEGFSIALLEACATKLPIIATNVGGNCEIIKHMTSGILVPPNNIKELVNAIKYFLENEEIASSCGINAYNWLHDNATLNIMYTNYLKLYRDTI